MKPTALCEVDTSVFMGNKDLPTATAYNEGQRDDPTHIIIYFARDGA